MQGLVPVESVSFIIVFLEGLLSFFSPCVIPLIPVYISYLSGNAKKTDENGIITYQRSKVFLHTLFFVLGISFAFFILGMSFTVLGSFFNKNQILFTRIGGIIILVLGLYQLGIFEFKFLQRERKFHLNLGDRKVNPLLAFIMGFTFSFAWTPCVGPALSSVLILSSGTGSVLIGNLLVIVYALGFVIPFLLLGLFTTQVLNFLNTHKKFLKYTVKAGGILLIIIGIMTFTGWMNGVSKYLSKFTPPSIVSEDNDRDNPTSEDVEDNNQDTSENIVPKEDNKNTDENTDTTEDPAVAEEPTPTEEPEMYPAFDFTLKDQYGNEHTLSDYKDKIVFLNFWATWCPPCKKEMPDIEALYKEYNLNQDDVVILGVANPSSDEYPKNTDVAKEEIIAFLDDNDYTFPTVFDETGEILANHFISAFPTTFIVDKEGNYYGYVASMLTKSQMESIIQQALEVTQ
ncbi:MAG: redoxin domain-containing protein [Clostridiales bacterium]|nr:redoxin domain-containing protein [Clostridiales bacterium]